MTVFPVIIDSRPAYLGDGGFGALSLALAPFGPSTLARHISGSLFPVTRRRAAVVRTFESSPAYEEALGGALVAGPSQTPDEFQAGLMAIEPSDWLLIVDPRSFPGVGYGSPTLLAPLFDQLPAAPRIVRHLVALGTTEAGTSERVEFDPTGRIRRIQRYYDNVTWTVTAGVCCSLVPASSLVQTGRVPFDSLVALRRAFASHSLASNDIPYRGPFSTSPPSAGCCD